MKDNLENIFISGFDNSFIGDDGAVIGDLVYSKDAFFENVHFRREWMSLGQIGYKAMIVNISDAIAMNALPQYALLAIAMPTDFTTVDVRELQRGIKKACRKFGIQVIGGDTIANSKLDISVTIVSKSDNPLYRKGIKEGDLLAFTGTLGGSLRDLNRLQNGEKISANSRFFKPRLRSEFVFAARKYMSGGMDISDGLFFELERLSKINQVGFEFTKKIAHNVGCSGEEYEMLVAFPPENLDRVIEIARKTKTKLTLFAKATKGRFVCECKPWHF